MPQNGDEWGHDGEVGAAAEDSRHGKSPPPRRSLVSLEKGLQWAARLSSSPQLEALKLREEVDYFPNDFPEPGSDIPEPAAPAFDEPMDAVSGAAFLGIRRDPSDGIMRVPSDGFVSAIQRGDARDSVLRLVDSCGGSNLPLDGTLGFGKAESSLNENAPAQLEVHGARSVDVSQDALPSRSPASARQRRGLDKQKEIIRKVSKIVKTPSTNQRFLRF